MKANLRPLILLISICFLVSSCQKELSDPGNTGVIQPGGAVFIISGTPGNCFSPVINGVYQSGVATDTANYITLQVNVADAGSYNILSSTNNNISFSATGNFSVTGIQSVVLKAKGTPAAAGVFDFTIGTNGCTFSVICSDTTSINADCKDCRYVPVCVGSTYEYIDSIADPLSGTMSFSKRQGDYLSAKDTAIDGRKFKKLEVFNGSASSFSFFNCTNAETSTIAYAVQSSTSGNVIVAFKSIELKANAVAGTSWSDTSSYASGSTLYRKHTILQKGLSINVLGVTFNDVIKVSVDQSILYPDPSVGLVNAGTTNYYFAKGVGLVEIVTYGENPLTNQTYLAYHSVLKSYFIP